MNDRRNSQPKDLLSFGPFRLFVAERLLKKADEPIPLGGRALDILIALTDQAGEVVTHKELISRVWPDVTVEDINLRVHIAALRKALGDGRDGDIPARHKEGTIDYIKMIANAPGSKYVMSVCTGAFLLGAAGLLDRRHCQVSSHNYGRFEREVPNAKLLKDPSLNFVQDGNLFTSNGPCSGLATALRVVEVHCGTGYKNNLRELIEYKVPPAKGALVENGKITNIAV